MLKKQLYAAPATEVLELRLEGVIAISDIETGSNNEQSGSGDGGWDIE